jgi:hypothetical protein
VQGFNCDELLYYDYGKLDDETEKKLNARKVDLDELIRRGSTLQSRPDVLMWALFAYIRTASAQGCYVYTVSAVVLSFFCTTLHSRWQLAA